MTYTILGVPYYCNGYYKGTIKIGALIMTYTILGFLIIITTI